LQIRSFVTRNAGGVRTHARRSGDHSGPAVDVAACRCSRVHAARSRLRRVLREAQVSQDESVAQHEQTSQTVRDPEVEFESYYGQQVIKTPVWKDPDVPLYFFFGGVAGASAVLAEGAAASNRPALRLTARALAATGAGLGTVALIHDLGRPERFLNMLRVFRPTSPLSMGSWILAPFAS